MAHISFMAIYRVVFFAMLLAAETILMFKMKRRRFFALRGVVGITGFIILSQFLPVTNDVLPLSITFGLFSLYAIVLNKFCYDIDWKTCIFFAVAGYSMQHIASILYELLSTFMSNNFITPVMNPYSSADAKFDLSNVLVFFFVYIIAYCILYVIFGKRMAQVDSVKTKSTKLLSVAGMMMLVEIVMNACIVAEHYSGALPYAYYCYGAFANLLCTLAVLIILFNFLARETLEDELEMANRMWHQERKQYEISKETIDMINLKCHDMKHQLHKLSSSISITPEALKEIEQSIEIYGSIAQTGNQALDVILTEKSLYCQKNGILINYIIDGKRLNFISDMDVYSLFGNMLDNAIQSVLNLDPEKRFVSLSVKVKGRLLSISSSNFYSGDIHMENGRPITLNPDNRYHGFGVRSMMLIVNKYGGTIGFQVQDKVFTLNIMFPLAVE